MFNITQSTSSDINGIAVCHKLCFNQSLSVRLGMPYIKKSFEWFLSKKNCFLFHIANNEGMVIGYCGGFVPAFVGDGSTSGIMQFTMKQAVMGIALRPWLLLHNEVTAMYPLIFKNIKRKIFKKKEQKKESPPVPEFSKRVGLVVVGVHPQYRGSGAFKSLMDEFEKHAVGFDIYKMVLSVKKTNAGAIKAYTKQGWFIAEEHPQTLEMYKYLT